MPKRSYRIINVSLLLACNIIILVFSLWIWVSQRNSDGGLKLPKTTNEINETDVYTSSAGLIGFAMFASSLTLFAALGGLVAMHFSQFAWLSFFDYFYLFATISYIGVLSIGLAASTTGSGYYRAYISAGSRNGRNQPMYGMAITVVAMISFILLWGPVVVITKRRGMIAAAKARLESPIQEADLAAGILDWSNFFPMSADAPESVKIRRVQHHVPLFHTYETIQRAGPSQQPLFVTFAPKCYATHGWVADYTRAWKFLDNKKQLLMNLDARKTVVNQLSEHLRDPTVCAAASKMPGILIQHPLAKGVATEGAARYHSPTCITIDYFDESSKSRIEYKTARLQWPYFDTPAVDSQAPSGPISNRDAASNQIRRERLFPIELQAHIYPKGVVIPKPSLV